MFRAIHWFYLCLRVDLSLTLANVSRNSVFLPLYEGSCEANSANASRNSCFCYLCLRVALTLTLANVSRNSLVLPLSEGRFQPNFIECSKEFIVFAFV